MDYDINALLFKMGIAELREAQQLRWHYIDGSDPDVNGLAEARFENNKRTLVVNLYHNRKNIEDDDGGFIEHSLETVQLSARRIGDSDLFRIIKIAFDGTEYEADDAAMLELCCSIFYARALDISEIMTKQRFKSAEAQLQSAEERLQQKHSQRRENARKAFEVSEQMVGVIVPFKPRSDAPLQRI